MGVALDRLALGHGGLWRHVVDWVSAPKVYDEVTIEVWRSKAKGLLKSLPTADKDGRKSCLMFLGMTKKNKYPPKWCLDRLKEAVLYAELPHDWSPLDPGDL